MYCARTVTGKNSFQINFQTLFSAIIYCHETECQQLAVAENVFKRDIDLKFTEGAFQPALFFSFENLAFNFCSAKETSVSLILF